MSATPALTDLHQLYREIDVSLENARSELAALESGHPDQYRTVRSLLERVQSARSLFSAERERLTRHQAWDRYTVAFLAHDDDPQSEALLTSLRTLFDDAQHHAAPDVLPAGTDVPAGRADTTDPTRVQMLTAHMERVRERIAEVHAGHLRAVRAIESEVLALRQDLDEMRDQPDGASMTGALLIGVMLGAALTWILLSWPGV